MNIEKTTRVSGLVLRDLQAAGLYTRPTSRKALRLWDDISGAFMSTQFANSRFLVPYLCDFKGWALFLDADMMIRENLEALFDSLDPSKALYCVHHKFEPDETEKMDGQAQQKYSRKNWSSFMIFNCEHEANKALDLELVNSLPGRDLHRFCWLEDDLIGELDPKWNYLVGHSDPAINPANVHWTDGGPWFKGFEDCEYADEWRSMLSLWAGARNAPIWG